MKKINGPAIFLAQFAGDKEPFNSLENIAKWTKPGGIVFISSPMLRYKDGKPYVTNPFHINEMPRDQFIKLINSIFKDFSFSFFYQNNDTFLPLLEENTGFCIALGRRNKVNIK